MPLSFKNMAASIDGQAYYADSISISESLGGLTFSTLGTNGSNSVSAKDPEGSIDLSFYVTTGAEINTITGQYGTTGFVTVRAGPLMAEKSLLNSFGVGGGPGGLIMGSVSYTYYGQLVSGSNTCTSDATIVPAHGAASTLILDEVGASGVLNFDYSFSQSFDVGYTVGSSAPARVTFQEGEKVLSFNAQAQDVNFSQSSLVGTSGLCHNDFGESGFSVKQCSVTLKNLCGSKIADLPVSGYLESRSFDVAANEKVQQSMSVKEVFFDGECSDG